MPTLKDSSTFVGFIFSCITQIEQALALEDRIIAQEKTTIDFQEFEYGILRCRYMLVYELTRYAILCSERDNQDKALSLLKRAEEYYHTHASKEVEIPSGYGTILSELDSLNPQKSYDMFTYVLFYLGQVEPWTITKIRLIV